MRCSCRIPNELKHLFSPFICSFCQVQNQSLWKMCYTTLSEVNSMLAYWSGWSRIIKLVTFQKEKTLASEKLIKCTSNWFPTSRNLLLSLDTQSEVISIHESPLIFYPAASCLFFFPLQSPTLVSSNGLFPCSQSHHLADGVVLIIIRLPSPTAAIQQPYWIQFSWWFQAKGLAPMWVMSCGWIICMGEPAGIGSKRSGSVE